MTKLLALLNGFFLIATFLVDLWKSARAREEGREEIRKAREASDKEAIERAKVIARDVDGLSDRSLDQRLSAYYRD